MKFLLAISGIANIIFCIALNLQSRTKNDLESRLNTQRENTKLVFLVSEEWKSAAMGCLETLNKDTETMEADIRALQKRIE